MAKGNGLGAKRLGLVPVPLGHVGQVLPLCTSDVQGQKQSKGSSGKQGLLNKHFLRSYPTRCQELV